MKFGQLILRKIIKIVATAGGGYSAPHDLLTGIKGPTSKRRGGVQGRGRERGRVKRGDMNGGRGWNGRASETMEGKGRKVEEGRGGKGGAGKTRHTNPSLLPAPLKMIANDTGSGNRKRKCSSTRVVK